MDCSIENNQVNPASKLIKVHLYFFSPRIARECCIFHEIRRQSNAATIFERSFTMSGIGVRRLAVFAMLFMAVFSALSQAAPGRWEKNLSGPGWTLRLDPKAE